MPDIREAQRALNIDYSKLWRMIRNGKIGATMQGGKWHIPDAEIDRVLQERTAPEFSAVELPARFNEQVATAQAFHLLGCQRQAIMNALAADVAEARANEDAELVAVLEGMLRHLPDARYRWDGDTWHLEMAGVDMPSRSVSQAVPVETANTGANGKG